MSIRFKFRSALKFDTITIDDKPYISIRELRLKIMEQKNLKACQDFDLVFSDPDTGAEFVDENVLVPSGSSVIIKRVPARGSAPSVVPGVDKLGNQQHNISNTGKASPPVKLQNMEVENVRDFGTKLYPAPKALLLGSDSDDDNVLHTKEFLRCSGTSLVKPNVLNNCPPKGDVELGVGSDMMQKNSKPAVEKFQKLDTLVDASRSQMPKTVLPSELRCSLCTAIFKEAVMIPCCQHSFCDKCIRLVLVENARCPKCLSAKCGVEDLLPNLSLRQAIEHFLESQGIIGNSENLLAMYIPDEESGTQAKPFPRVVPVRQRDPILPHSPSATYQSKFRNNGSAAGASSNINLEAGTIPVLTSQMMNQMRYRVRDAADGHPTFETVAKGCAPATEFEGENQHSKLHPNLMAKEEGFWLNNADGAGRFSATSEYRRGDRTCFMCGSPDHFIRDCPAASGQYPMMQTGDAMYPQSMPAYGPPYWHGNSYPQIGSFHSVYANPGMLSYDPNIVKVNPFAVYSYMPCMYPPTPMPHGLTRMGGFAPSMMTGAELPFMQTDFMGYQGIERPSAMQDHLNREKVYGGDASNNDYYYNEPSQCPAGEPQEESDFGEHDIKMSQMRLRRTLRNQEAHPVNERHEKGSRSSAAGRDHRAQYFDGSSPEIDTSNNSIRHSRDSRHKHRHRTSRRHSGKSSDSTRSHHRGQKESATSRKRVDADAIRRNQKYHSHTESGPELSSSGDRKRQRREKETSHSSRHGSRKVKSTDHEGWEMVAGLDEDSREEYHHRHHHHKHRRCH